MQIQHPFLNSKILDNNHQDLNIYKKDIGLIYRLIQLSKCILIFSFTLGTALLYSKTREWILDWYEEFRSGKRIIKELGFADDFEDDFEGDDLSLPSAVATADKIRKIGDSSLLSPNVVKFLDTAKNDLQSLNKSELEEGLKAALTEANNITLAEDKTTVFAVAEKVSRIYRETELNFQKALTTNLETAEKIGHAFTHLGTQISQANSTLGLRLQSFGTHQFKQHTMAIQEQKFTNGTTRIRLDAKLGNPTRIQLESIINHITHNSKMFHSALPKSFCTSVSISSEQTVYLPKEDVGVKKWAGVINPLSGKKIDVGNKSHVIHFVGLGKVKIGNDPTILTEYNHFSIEFDPSVKKEQMGDKLHILFSALGLGPCSSISRPEDIERLKMIQIFRQFCPAQAYDFAKNLEIFEESLESLKKRMIVADASMKNKLEEHLPNMYQQEIYPGKKEEHQGQFVWCMKGLAEDAAKEGALGLIATTGAVNDENDLLSILEGGSLSSQDRFTLGICTEGWSSVTDIGTGGGDSIFTRLLTQSCLNAANSQNGAILYDLNLIERMGYCYGSDKFGKKEPVTYKARPNIIDLAKQIQNTGSVGGNEVLIHNRIPPQYIKKIFVPSLDQKNKTIAAMKKAKLTTELQGQHFFNGILVENFIQEPSALKLEHFI